tara:strand:- start:285 stop:3227 length:2943 start_codon:yes stop_codon:yes gene_type:complete
MDLKNVKVKDYFDIHEFYEKEFGKGRVIILMQVGSFHECYGTDLHGADVSKIANMLEISYTMKDKKKSQSKSNPMMLGFPIYVVDNWVEKLINLNFNVVVIDQVTSPPNPKRALREVYTPATYFNSNNIETSKTKSFITFINFTLIEDKTKTKNINMIIGLACYNVTTGNGYFFENYSNIKDPYLCLDEISNILDSYPPKQFLIHFTDEMKYMDMSLDDIMHYLNISKESVTIISSNNIDYNTILKKREQKKLLAEVYNITNNNQIFDNLNISLYHMACISLCFILAFIKKHQPLLLRKLNRAELIVNDNKLYFGNKPLKQLDIISDQKKDLFYLLDKTKTNMGKRFFREQLSQPLTNIKKINKRYNDIEKIMSLDKNNMELLNESLKEIADIEKLLRKIQTEKIVPNQFYIFYLSFMSIYNLFNNKTIRKILKVKKKNISNLVLFLEKIEKIFKLDYMSTYNFYNYVEDTSTIFNKDIIEEIDNLVLSISNNNSYIQILAEKLSELILEKKNGLLMTIKYNERDGTHLLLTNRRHKMLIQQIKNKKIKVIKVLDMNIEISKLTFKETSNKTKCNIKIIVPQINDITSMVNMNKIKLATMNKQYFYKTMEDILEFNETFLYFIKKIEYIDFINNGAINATTKGYVKPIIKESNNSFFKATELRHPIVEELFEEIEYLPHNIMLGNNTDNLGIVLYGINGSGKSTLMKSIGINIIMAQMGYYVAAKEFIYSPYSSIFTRIKGNDNLFKRLSSFYVEMAELKAILQRNNNRTLVLADELCRGTEYKSATIIVSYMLERLTLNNSSFITATHLHNIAELPLIKKLKNVNVKHISVEYDNINNNLIFSRKLLEGPGEDFYGLKVAKFLLKDDDFNERSKYIEDEYNTSIENMNLNQINKYNSILEVKECHLCKSKKNLEVHHINWQKDCNKFYVINKPQIKKNSLANLVTLCRKCHDKVDRNNIMIEGYHDTIKGKKLKVKVCK